MGAYITATGRFLPGEPVPNEEIEDYIGRAGLASADLREMILTNSGIKTRHYAIDKNQQTVFSNTQMAAAAVREAVGRAGLGPDDVEMLAAATTIPDLLGPGHASMIHGELGYAPMEVMTAHGICSSGMMALKDAYLQVVAGEKRNAVVVASEFASRGFKSSRYAEMQSVVEDGSLPMETAFLRYMLSDGAGAAVLTDRPNAAGISLRIDWITLTSYANTEQACMFFGSNANDCAKTWGDYPTATEAVRDGALAPRQKLSLLPHLVEVGITEYQRLIAAGKFDPARVTWFPVHYSSERMKELLLGEFKRRGIDPGRLEGWYSNLTRVGNIGSASIYLILDEMLREGLISKGDTLLCMVPESGRFIVSFMHLTAVDAAA
ncbi:3-oxoacyl-[acyl-carrier-protein] synthase III C-terminal domain-containing protein [Nocardia amamiensis]|uniref:3-oxoacyl-[acyl-carrier-protein] synthase III C-terminal domain-containing protein n=1 Tax=Nocardia amamiensis TaxID=404578 RepID=UPI000832DDB2|nr:3-oxoacyl-[acyl-carrier-protein] synthase III C-terminal domain-containing protein [Nocardia amamiensis]